MTARPLREVLDEELRALAADRAEALIAHHASGSAAANVRVIEKHRADRAEDVKRFHAARARAEGAADPCHVCKDWRTVFCNGDGFGYCVEHYPAGSL